MTGFRIFNKSLISCPARPEPFGSAPGLAPGRIRYRGEAPRGAGGHGIPTGTRDLGGFGAVERSVFPGELPPGSSGPPRGRVGACPPPVPKSQIPGLGGTAFPPGYGIWGIWGRREQRFPRGAPTLQLGATSGIFGEAKSQIPGLEGTGFPLGPRIWGDWGRGEQHSQVAPTLHTPPGGSVPPRGSLGWHLGAPPIPKSQIPVLEGTAFPLGCGIWGGFGLHSQDLPAGGITQEGSWPPPHPGLTFGGGLGQHLGPPFPNPNPKSHIPNPTPSQFLGSPAADLAPGGGWALPGVSPLILVVGGGHTPLNLGPFLGGHNPGVEDSHPRPFPLLLPGDFGDGEGGWRGNPGGAGLGKGGGGFGVP
ncbi:collagen alpha-1(III) chain-like [Pseudopipra pipra]|uniref:collagen alpha-1(III) chain-like n=1 Tax=Pseudopipra pipra TaxID=415032 RepID=UPI0031390B47